MVNVAYNGGDGSGFGCEIFEGAMRHVMRWWPIVLIACGGPSRDRVDRVLLHTIESDDVVQGGIEGRVLPDGARTDGQPTVWIGDHAPQDGQEWEQLGEVGVWRVQRPGEASQFAVSLDETEQSQSWKAQGSPLRSWVQHGPASPGGELVVTALMQPPARMTRRPCVTLLVGERRLNLGTLLQGRGGFVPGAGPRLTVRHRAMVPVPDWMSPGPVEASFGLTDCMTGREITPVVSVPLRIDDAGRPADDALTERIGEAQPEAAWAQPRGRRKGLRKHADGSYSEVVGPPLPRVERGKAFGLLVTPPLTLGPWGAPDGTAMPLSPLTSMLEEADAAVVHLASSASMAGDSPLDGPVSRVRPEVLAHLPALGVDGVMIGQSARRIQGDRTAENAASLRLSVDRVVVGDNENAVQAFLLTGNGKLDDLKRQREALPADAVVLLSWEDSAVDEQAFARAVLDSGLDGAWVVGGAFRGVSLPGGVPIVWGVPPMKWSQPTFALRWYLNPEGPIRLDLVGIKKRAARWGRDSVELDDRWRQAQQWSDARDVRLVIGRQIAAVSISDHRPSVRSVPAGLGEARVATEQTMEPTGLPERCVAQGELGGEPIGSIEGLDLMQARILDQRGGPNDPVEAELTWRVRGSVSPGRVQWYVEGIGSNWRHSSEPCDGLVSFHELKAGDWVRDRVLLYPPEGTPAGEGTLNLGVRIGGARMTFESNRFHRVGMVRMAPAANVE